MSDLIVRTEKTADGLRNRLFDLLDLVIKEEIDLARVEAACAISDQIRLSAEVELKIQIEQEEMNKKAQQRLALTASSIESMSEVCSDEA